jgi:hypothetical protein
VTEVVAHPDAQDLFRDRAHRIAASLQTGIALHHGGLASLTKEKIDVDGF